MTERTPQFVVVGIGADGWEGLTRAAQHELASATTIVGSDRQLSLLENHASAALIAWRSPMSGHLTELIDAASSGIVHVLASGDPMFHGVGASIVARVGGDAVRVIPTVSSASLAAARMGWDLAQTDVVSLVRASVASVLAHVGQPRLLVLSRDEHTPTQLARVLADNGFGESTLTVLAQLGGPGERRVSAIAANWSVPVGDSLNVIAVNVVGPQRVCTPGLDDSSYDHDGQLTKQLVRSVTVCALAPRGGEVLWDVGAGSGSIGIEWLRSDTSSRTVAFEASPVRSERVVANANRHGVGDRIQVLGAAPAALDDATDPDAAFIGGGLTQQVFDAVWARLPQAGRLVVNAVTIENQTLLAELFAHHGGTLTRLGVEHAAPLGTMTTWRPALPIVQWVVTKAGTANADKESGVS